MRAEKLREITKEMCASNSKDKREHFSEKYPTFTKNYPTLFEMCCNDPFDIKKMDFMINMLQQVQNNKISQHDASANVGQILYDEYVKPIVAPSPSPPPSSPYSSSGRRSEKKNIGEE
jgi:hypothetical protein